MREYALEQCSNMSDMPETEPKITVQTKSHLWIHIYRYVFRILRNM